MTHWAAPYIGQPWDPATQHCWAFCRRVWHEVFGIEVAEVSVDGSSAHAARRAFGQDPHAAGWDKVDSPAEGDAVLMAMGARPCHVGVWAAPAPSAGVLHAVEKTGVIFTPPARLAAMGYRIVGFYRRLG